MSASRDPAAPRPRHLWAWRWVLPSNVEACSRVGCMATRRSTGSGHHEFRVTADAAWQREVPPCGGVLAGPQPRTRRTIESGRRSRARVTP